jgi:hypothetical protein
MGAPQPEQVPAPEPAAAGGLEARQPSSAPAVPSVERSSLEQLEFAVSVAESLGLGLHLRLAVEPIARAATQGSEGVGPLREAAWLIDRYIALIDARPIGADLHQTAARLARTGDTIQDLKGLAEALRPERDPA